MIEVAWPIDLAHRQRVRDELEGTFFVEAGAGTGKTTALVGRIVELVKAGRVRMDTLAAITFTEAAAAELRDRIRQGLETAAADAALDAEPRANCETAAREVDLASIQTIHAFAGTLLRTYPIEAGLAPGFATLDEIQRDLAFEERFRAWLYDEVPDAANGSLSEAVRRAFALGLTPERLRALAAGLQEQYDLFTPSTRWDYDPPPDARTVANSWGDALRALERYLPCAHDPEHDPLAREVRRTRFSAQRLAQAVDEHTALEALQQLLERPPKWNRGRQSDWDDGKRVVAEIKRVFKDVVEEAEATVAAHRTAALAELLAHLRDFSLAYAAERKRLGVATFQDLLTWARDLLRDHPEVRRRAQAQYQRLLVDEFQDTDPLQAEIALFLSSDPAQAEVRDWRNLRLVPGKLFLVGDPKQSIYRFRRADIAMYDAIGAQFVGVAERLSLVQNFRSVAPIIEWVNHHFRHDMQELAGVQARYTDLYPRPPEESPSRDGDWGARWVGTQSDATAAQRWSLEAETIAGLVRQVVEERWAVLDPEQGAVRPVRYQDVCVLLPTRTNLRRLERAFEGVGIPYRMQSGTLVLNTQEVRDLLACLRAIDDPSDQVALVAALRSPAYGCSDVDLLRWVENGGSLSYAGELDDQRGCDGPVRDAFASLGALHRSRLDAPPAVVVERFIRERLLAVQAFGHPRPREAWRRLRYIVAQARDLAASGRPSLRAFLDWLDTLQRQAYYDAESPTPEGDEDAVQLMTVHGAKGLEFPVVILSGLGSRPRDPGTLHFAPDRRLCRLEIRSGVFRTAGYDDAREKQLEAAEAIRLLYVAATRAREHLVLCLFRGKDACDAQRIASILAEAPGPLCREIPLPLPGVGPTALTSIRVEETDPDVHREEEQRWIERRARRIASVARQRHLTPAGLAARLTPQAGAADLATVETSNDGSSDDRASDDGPAGEDEFGPPLQDAGETALLLRGGRGDTALGRAMHAVLQSIDLTTPDGLDAIAHGAAARQGVPERAPEIAQLANRFQSSATIQALLASGRSWREVPVATEIDGVILDGVIDLLHEAPDGRLTLVAFVTDPAADAPSLDRLLANHEWRGVAHALALQHTLNRAADRCVLLFAEAQGVVEHEVPDLPAAVNRIRRAAGLREAGSS